MRQEDITNLAAIQDEIREVSEKIAALEKESTKLVQHLVKLQTKLVKECTHPTVRKGSIYTEGGYDYVSRTEYYTECTICKTRTITNTVKGYYS